MYKNFSVLAIYVFCVACEAGVGARDIGRSSNVTEGPSTSPPVPALTTMTTSTVAEVNATYNASAILECITCMNKQPRIKELIRVQKVAQRLEYIKKQLNLNLPFSKISFVDPPKLETLPDFLVDQLINSPSQEEEEEVREGDENQMVLFPEQETSNCHPPIKNSVCLTFKLGEAPMLNSINEAIVWLSSAKLASKSRTQNFTVMNGWALDAVTPNSNVHSKEQEIEEIDGWYGVDVKDYLPLWERKPNNTEHTFVIQCDGCELLATSSPSVDAATSSPSVNTTTSQVSSFMFLRATKNTRSRVKRGVSCEYSADECCRDNLEVDFSTLGISYKMIIYPVKFNAYMCRGNCYFYSSIETEKHYATMLVTLRTNKTATQGLRLPTTCCTPTRLSGLSVIYATSDTSFHKATIPNMVVDSCGCV